MKEWKESEAMHELTDAELQILMQTEGLMELTDLSKVLHAYLSGENQTELAFITTLLMGKVIQLTLTLNEMKNLVDDELLKLAIQIKDQPFNN